MKKKLLYLFCAIFIVLPSTACSGFGDAAQKDEDLCIFASDLYRPFITRAMADYKSSHPDVNVTLYEGEADSGLSHKELISKVFAEMMAGKGPDLIVAASYDANIYKLVEAGAFCDLSPYFDNGVSLDEKEYHGDILESGEFESKRYVVPLSYNFPILLSTQAKLEQAGFALDACGNIDTLCEEAAGYMERPDAQCLLFSAYTEEYISYLMPNGINFTDRTIGLKNPVYENYFALLKAAQALWDQQGDSSENARTDLDMILDGNGLFVIEENLDSLLSSLTTHVNESPSFLPLPNTEGNATANIDLFAAVKNSSSNRRNAADFIKILLEKDAQYEFASHGLGFPVNKAAELEVYNWEAGQGFSCLTDFQRIQELLCGPKTVRFSCFLINEDIMKYMRPYWNGESSYQECVENAVPQLEIYLDE